MFYQTLETLP